MQGNYKPTLLMNNPSDAPSDSSTERNEHTHPEDDHWAKHGVNMTSRACEEFA
jgi:hypothetical protein